MRILWIEDKVGQIGRFVELLGEDHRVTVAKTGEAALEEIGEAVDSGEPYDVVILDIMLPKGEGRRIDEDIRPEFMGEEVLRRMREHQLCWPVVGVSAIADERLRARICHNYSFVVDILKKPVTRQELWVALSRAMADS